MKVKRKLKNDKIEIARLKELLKKAQIDRFRLNKLDAGTYNLKTEKYKNKLNKLKLEIPVLESIISGKKIKRVEKKKGVLTVKKW